MLLHYKVENPVDISSTGDENFKSWKYKSDDFTVAAFWTPFLVKAETADSDGPTHTGLFTLYLDELDEKWTAQIGDFDYVILSPGHWFSGPAVYYECRRLVGCRFCQMAGVTDLPACYGYRRAFQAAFKAINGLKNVEGIVFLRTFAPSHFQ